MSDDRTGVTVVAASALVAVLALAAPLLSIGQPVELLAVLGGILLGPGSLACRLATGAKWPDCLMIGVAVNIAGLMLLALVAIAVHFWQPKVELVIPLTTLVLALALYRRESRR